MSRVVDRGTSGDLDPSTTIRASSRPPHRIPRSLEFAAAVSWRLLIVGAAVIALFLLLTKLQLVFVSTAAAVLIACVLWPVVARLRTVGAPPALAALLPLLAFFGLVAAAIWLLAPHTADDIRNLDVDPSGSADAVKAWLVQGPLGFSESQVQTFFDRAEAQLRSLGNRAARGIWDGAVFAVELVAGIVLTIVLSFLFLKDGDRMWRWARGFVPAARREVWDEIALDVRNVLGAFLRGTTIVAAADAIGIGLGLYLLGVPLVIPIALLTFVGGFVPLIGATVAGLVAVGIAFVSNGFWVALAALGVVLLVQQLEANIVQPIVVGRSVQLHPAVILLAVGAGAVLWGIGGAVLAVPITAAVSTVLGHIRARPSPHTLPHGEMVVEET